MQGPRQRDAVGEHRVLRPAFSSGLCSAGPHEGRRLSNTHSHCGLFPNSFIHSTSMFRALSRFEVSRSVAKLGVNNYQNNTGACEQGCLGILAALPEEMRHLKTEGQEGFGQMEWDGDGCLRGLEVA